MPNDPSWDIMPVANPELRASKRRGVIDRVLLKDPVGLEEPLRQLRDRDQVVVPSSLDAACRRLLLRAQDAIRSALESGPDEADLPEIVAESTLRWHEWEIAAALRDVTELRAEHERQCGGRARDR